MSNDNAVKFDINNLVREEIVTDQRIGSIRILTPIKADGSVDESRKTSYYGQSQIMTPAGALPLNFEIEAENLSEAIEKFGDAAQKGMEQTMKELQEYQREQASKIVVPGQDVASKIQMP